MYGDQMCGPTLGPRSWRKGSEAKADEAYKTARAMAKSEARRWPWEPHQHLPLFTDATEGYEIESKYSIGRRDKSRFTIEGTAVPGRDRDFSPGFLPLPKPDTEFALKWKNLHRNRKAWYSSGNAIEAKEFLHKLYVIEGHKRASLATYLRYDPIPIKIERHIPTQAGDEATKEYHAYLQFENYSGLSDIWFSNQDGYNWLHDTITKMFHGTPYKVEAFIREMYNPFKTIYNQLDDKRLQHVPPGDLLKSYIENHWHPQTRSGKKSGLKKDLKRLAKKDSLGRGR